MPTQGNRISGGREAEGWWAVPTLRLLDLPIQQEQSVIVDGEWYRLG